MTHPRIGLSTCPTTSIWVVGGGITGCLVALRLARAGFDVCLHEDSSNLGGVLTDVVIDGESWLRGCQYIQPGRLAEAGFPVPSADRIRLFANRVASATYTPGEVLMAQGCEGPATRERVADMAQILDAHLDSENARQRIAAYPAAVQGAMDLTLRNGGLDPGEVWGPSIVGLQMARVFFPGQEAETSQLKQCSPALDALIGVAPASSGALVGLPEAGYSEWFARIHSELLSAGVRVHLDSRVRLRARDASVEVLGSADCRSTVIGGVWCSSPTPLHSFMTSDNRLMNQHVYHSYWHLDAVAPHGFEDHYVQFFGHPAGIIRATSYAMQNEARVVVEAIHPSKDGALRLDPDHVLSASRHLGLDIGSVRMHHGALNFPTVGVRDRHNLDKLASNLRKHQWIGGGWVHYGRARKLQIISAGLVELWDA